MFRNQRAVLLKEGRRPSSKDPSRVFPYRPFHGIFEFPHKLYRYISKSVYYYRLKGDQEVVETDRIKVENTKDGQFSLTISNVEDSDYAEVNFRIKIHIITVKLTLNYLIVHGQGDQCCWRSDGCS